MTTAEEFARRRRALENACVAFLEADAQPSPDEFPDDWRPAGPDQALNDLATSQTPRVVKLQQMIEALRRNPGVYEELDEPIRLVLAYTLPTAEGESPPQWQVDVAKRHLDDVVRAPGGQRFQEQHWLQFVEGAGDLFRFDVPERTFRGRGRCNDMETAPKRTPDGEVVDSVVITSEFRSDQPPSAFVDYVNPERWPDCSSFWQEMRPLTEPIPVPDMGGYDRVFEEVVDIGPQTLRVPLAVGFRVSPDRSRVWARFNLDPGRYLDRKAAKDPQDRVAVDVDTGIVSAEWVPGSGGRETLVRATKYLRAVPGGGAQLFPRLACDVGWPELMMAMAYRCSTDGPPPEGASAAEAAAPGAGAADPAEAAVQRFVQQVVAECQQGIRDTGPAMQRLLRSFTGPSWSVGWVNDLLDIGMETTRRYGRVASHLRGLADDLGRAADQRRQR